MKPSIPTLTALHKTKAYFLVLVIWLLGPLLTSQAEDAVDILKGIARRAYQATQKPRLPVGAMTRDSDDGNSKILMLTSESDRTLIIGVTLSRVSTGETKTFSYKSEPRKTEEFAIPGGWLDNGAARATLSHPDFEPGIWDIAQLPPIPRLSVEQYGNWLLGQTFVYKKGIIFDDSWRIDNGELSELKLLQVFRAAPGGYIASVSFKIKGGGKTIEVAEGQIAYENASEPGKLQFRSFKPISVTVRDN